MSQTVGVDAPGNQRRLDDALVGSLGVVLEATSVLPRVVQEQREMIAQRVRLAHLVGRFTVSVGSRQLRQRLDRAAQRAARPLGARVQRDGESRTVAVDEPAGPDIATPSNAPAGAHRDGEPAPRISASARPGASDPAHAAVDLAIPDYDSLSASQVLPRLADLSASELAAVAAHERAHRGRRTVLGRIEQLGA